MTVRDQSDKMAKNAESWPMIDALMGGTAAMRAMGEQLLPKWPNEDGESYAARKQVATLHPVFRRTALVNAARPLAKPPTIDPGGLPEEWLENVDLDGTSLPAFAYAELVQALAYGLAGVLVDYPPASGARTVAQQKQSGARPYLVAYKGSDILGWRVQNGKLMQLRLLEHVEEDEGKWGTEEIEQVRVLTPGSWETYRETDNGAGQKEWTLYDQGPTTLTDVIPFVFVYGLRKGFGIGESPLIDLAYQNVEHYQSSSDQQTILHVARVPILTAVGFDESDEITIGASHAVTTTNKDAKLSYTEHSGEAIGAGRQSLLDLEERMRATGAELISQKPVQTTATQINSEGAAVKSTLQQIVEQFEEDLEDLLILMGRFQGLDVKPEIELHKEFSDPPASDTQALSGARSAGAISRQTHFEELQRRDIVQGDRTWEDEQKRIAQERAAEPAPTTPPQTPPQPQPSNPAQ